MDELPARINGKAPLAIVPMAPSEFVEFTIGGRALRIPVLTLWDIERIREPFLALKADEWWADYARKVMSIIAILTDTDEDDLRKRCTLKEAHDLAGSLSELLTKSGWTTEGEAEAARSGTGTLTASPPSSQSEESAVETPSE